MFDYNSPIEIIMKDLKTEIDNQTVKAVQNVGITVFSNFHFSQSPQMQENDFCSYGEKLKSDNVIEKVYFKINVYFTKFLGVIL